MSECGKLVDSYASELQITITYCKIKDGKKKKLNIKNVKFGNGIGNKGDTHRYGEGNMKYELGYPLFIFSTFFFGKNEGPKTQKERQEKN